MTVRIYNIAWIGMCLLLVALSGCSLPGTNSNASASITPLALTPQPKAPTPTASAAKDTDWTTYHRDNARTGSVANMPDPQQLTQTWKVHLDGAVYAEPLVVGERVIVATEGDSLYSLDIHTGQTQWHTNVGTPVPQSTLPCGDIDPLGITGTPVYDPATGLVFAVAEVSGPAHVLVGVDANTGQVRVRRSADTADMDPRVHQERAALALSQGKVYIAYGGLDGDCGAYHGRVIASQTDGQGPLLSYVLPTTREGGIWAVSGPAVDSAGKVYVAVGNGEVTSGDWDHTDSVLRLSPTLQLEDGFAPDQWAKDNAADADLGSMGPVLLPDGTIFAAGKSGLGYLLHSNALGGVGGQAFVKSACRAFGGAATVGSTVFVPCTSGIRQVQVGPGPSFTLGWQASVKAVTSPVVGGHTVYSLNPAGTLYALDADSGAVRASVPIDQTSRFNSPTLSGNSVFVGTMSGVVAVAVS